MKKRILLDTCVLIYHGQAKNKATHALIQKFWDDVQQNKDNYKLYISEITQQEIQVRLPIIRRQKEKVAKSIETLLQTIEVIKYAGDRSIEHQIRCVASHVKTTYSVRCPNGKEMEPPGVNDARIIFSAFQQDLTIVTKNIKDFMIYACMDRVLWDSEHNSQVPIDSTLFNKIQSDPKVTELIAHLNQGAASSQLTYIQPQINALRRQLDYSVNPFVRKRIAPPAKGRSDHF